MIIKEKVVHFYKWQVRGEQIQVIGLQGTSGGGLTFSFYKGKNELTENKPELTKEFVTELSNQKK